MSNTLPRIRVVATASVFFFLVGCATTNSKSSIGKDLGALIGAAVGAHQGKNKSRKTQTAYTLAGAAMGGLAGQGIGKYLDSKDRRRMEATAQRALASNRVQTWSNPRNKTSGRAKPLQTYTTSGRTCRTVQQAILVNGTERTENVKACKGSNGWVIQA